MIPLYYYQAWPLLEEVTYCTFSAHKYNPTIRNSDIPQEPFIDS